MSATKVEFTEAQDYLLSLGNEVTAMKLGLDNIRTLLKGLGDPQNGYLKVQVAGTNGKGSVCAFLESICMEAGVLTGLFTSPHLVSITERIRISGRDICESDFARFATRVRGVSEDLVTRGVLESVPTFFEQATAIALSAFADANMELAILETGLGGRLDATTAADAEIAAITRIDYDHQQYLGDSLAEIAGEKAAIIRPGSPVVVGAQADEAMTVIKGVCRDIEVEPRFAVDVKLPTSSLGLRGDHQRENARIAVALADELRAHFDISDGAIVAGLEQARHQGRLEYQDEFLFDGAHNPGGAAALATFLDQYEERPITLVFGCMKDKDVHPIAEVLFPRAANVVLTQPENTRAMPVEELARAAASLSMTVHSEPAMSEAVRLARQLNGSAGVILVTGSLYLVGDVKRLLGRTNTEI